MDIPIEIFITALASCFMLAIFGFLRDEQIPATLAFAGMFLLFLTMITDNITFTNNKLLTSDKIKNNVTAGVIVNSTQTNIYSLNSFPFINQIKVFFALMSAILMLVGALMTFKEQS